MLKGMFTKPENWRMYWKEFMHQCVEIGIGALPRRLFFRFQGSFNFKLLSNICILNQSFIYLREFVLSLFHKCWLNLLINLNF